MKRNYSSRKKGEKKKKKKDFWQQMFLRGILKVFCFVKNREISMKFMQKSY